MTPEADMDQDEAHSQDHESSSEPEVDQLDSISHTTESTQGSEMNQSDSNSYQGKEPTPEPDVYQDHETFTSAF